MSSWHLLEREREKIQSLKRNCFKQTEHEIFILFFIFIGFTIGQEEKGNNQNSIGLLIKQKKNVAYIYLFSIARQI